MKKLIDYSKLWWSIKPDSILCEYLDEFLAYNPFFILEDLVNAFTTKAWQNNLYEKGNKSLIVLDPKLQTHFKSYLLNVDDLYERFIDHVFVASDEDSLKLQQEYIHNNLVIPVTDQFIFQDSLSLFWVDPVFNFIVNKNKKQLYSLEELKQLFLNYCVSDKIDIEQIDTFYFKIHKSSDLAQTFKFEHFHISQIEDILLQIVKYMGKQNTIEHNCTTLKQTLTQVNSDMLNFVTYLINKNSNMLPYMYSNISI